ncbi:hypothetical protein BCT46_23685 [Vibrio sp. 10N.261.46.E8]|nr:hypothetical protein BH584_23845 [Vibrio sp. 10N.261.45.E1]PMJ25764.1 hypothetical protein BCU27_09890 [Vibrio sp. 10N.286.45.B6]PML84441.1 hypothetical protein BCT66_17500 [Vibrio sp. 10N.261.49.E11]PMM90171.1 hypothetical protein BCT46_23685 [Vibrio sp. 10N.261.46.E8]PMN46134.1 hypothetical protein BCT32_11105 [Vibrio sp. 10N.261.45.E11]PMN79289.1 hypothetical protein BCT22_17895 [Vibrio sp. 10N.261.45.A1]
MLKLTRFWLSVYSVYLFSVYVKYNGKVRDCVSFSIEMLLKTTSAFAVFIYIAKWLGLPENVARPISSLFTISAITLFFISVHYYRRFRALYDNMLCLHA